MPVLCFIAMQFAVKEAVLSGVRSFNDIMPYHADDALSPSHTKERCVTQSNLKKYQKMKESQIQHDETPR